MAAARLTPAVLDDAVSESKLSPRARHIFLKLGIRADWDTGEVPDDRALSLTDLMHRTGYGRRSVREGLFELQEDGWVTRQPPPEDKSRREHAITRTWVHLPGSPLMLATRERCTGPDHRARRRAHQNRQRKWAAETPDWAGDAHLVALAATTLAALNHGRPVDEASARAAVAAVLGGRPRGYFRRKPARYLVMALQSDPARFLPTPTPAPPPPPGPAPGAEVAAAGAALVRQAAPHHLGRPPDPPP